MKICHFLALKNGEERSILQNMEEYTPEYRPTNAKFIEKSLKKFDIYIYFFNNLV